MAYALTEFIRILTDGETDRDSPWAEDIAQTIRNNAREIMRLVIGDDILEASLNGDPTDNTTADSFFDVDTVTAGAIDRDDQFNGLYVHFTSGTIFTNNSLNRYKITDTNAASNRITVSGQIFSDGARDDDTFVIVGQTHDGDASAPDGPAIDLKNLINVLEGVTMNQDLADALTDPDGNRISAASKSNPFATQDDTGGAFVWIDDGTAVINESSPASGLVSIASQVPVGTQNAQLYADLNPITGGGDMEMRFRDFSGTYRVVARAFDNSNNDVRVGSCAIVPVNGSRQIDRETVEGGGAGGTFRAEIRGYQQ